MAEQIQEGQRYLIIKALLRKTKYSLICLHFSNEVLLTDRSGGAVTDRTVSEQTDANLPKTITECFKSLFNYEWNECFTELTKRYTDDYAIELLRRWLKVGIQDRRFGFVVFRTVYT